MSDWLVDNKRNNISVSLIYFMVVLLFVFIADIQGWGVSPRGAGFLFGQDVVTQVRGNSLRSPCVV